MIVIYSKLLKYIKKIHLDRGNVLAKCYEQSRIIEVKTLYVYIAEKTYDGRGGSLNQREDINSGYSKAKIRVFLFLLVFLINGLISKNHNIIGKPTSLLYKIVRFRLFFSNAKFSLCIGALLMLYKVYYYVS